MIDVSSMVKRAADQEEKRKKLSSTEAAALALAPVPVHLIGSALASGGSSKDRELIRSLIQLGQKKGIEFRRYPKETLAGKIWRLAKGNFRAGEGSSVPMPDLSKVSPDWRSVPYPAPGDPPPTWGDVAGKKIIWKPRSAGMLAHEIGHMDERRMPKVIQLIEAHGPSVGMGIGALGALASKTPKDAERMGQIGAILAAGVAVPGLYREIAASARGLSALRQAGASTGKILGQGLGRMAPAFLASAAKASLAPLTSLVLSKLIASTKKEDGK